MKLVLLALDYDGTLAENGALGADAPDALREARQRGVVVVLVTGRVLKDLASCMGRFDLFDAIVAENGAVLHFPRTGRSTLLAAPPADVFLAELTRRSVPFATGECVVECDAKHSEQVLAAVRDLALPLILAFNRGRLMVLPQSIGKGSGLREAARALRVSLHNALAIGDGENDHDLLGVCEHGVAVAWGTPALQRSADEVLSTKGREESGSAAVARRIRSAVLEGRLPQTSTARRSLHIGERRDGTPLSLEVLSRNLLIVGDAQSGKSWMAGLVSEQLVLHRYCVCVIDPEGDYVTLESLPGVMVIGGEEHPPAFEVVEHFLRFPDLSLVINLSRTSLPRKRAYVPALLEQLESLRKRTGLPHSIVLDEAHYFLRGAQAPTSLAPGGAGYTLVTFRASELAPAALTAASLVVVARESDPAEAELLRATFGAGWAPQRWCESLASLEIDEAAILPAAPEAGGELLRFRLARRLTRHVRHQHKYMSAAVQAGHEFVFRRAGHDTGLRAASLQELAAVLSAAPEQRFESHLHQGDFSRWIEDVFRDHALAEEVRSIEDGWRRGTVTRPHDRIVRAVERRYAALAGEPIATGAELPASCGTPPAEALGGAAQGADEASRSEALIERRIQGRIQGRRDAPKI